MSMSSSNDTTTSGTTKPRLSLLSTSRQSGIRQESDDQTDQQITIVSATPDDYVNIANLNPSIRDTTATTKIEKSLQSTNQREISNTERFPFHGEKEQSRLNVNNIQDDARKMNVSKEDLIRIITLLKYELQTKETALAAIKCEQLKRLINPIEISRSSLADTYIALQDRLKARDQNNNSNNNHTNTVENTQLKNQEKQQTKVQDNDDGDNESLNILNAQLELLDRHPLLALPRDSIYCLDYNCNELSTKNYLNLKIQHLDNLITQHRRFRFFMNERLRRSEKRYLDLARDLELEKSMKYENERSIYRTSGKSVLLRHIDQLKESLEKVKKDKQVIVMTLLNQLLDEREQTEALKTKLKEYETNSTSSIEKTTGERENLLRMETELSNLNTRLKKQSMVYAKEKNELQSTITDLETENLSLKNKMEQQERQIAALSMKQLSTGGSSSSKDIGQNATFSSPNRANQQSGSKPVNRAAYKPPFNATTPAVVTRSSIGSTTPAKISPTRALPASQRPTKPQVPAKPAQLLDQQRNPLVL